MKRDIRKSFYGDYFAIDIIDGNKSIVETPLYLKKNEEKEIRMRYDFDVWDGSHTFHQSEMLKAYIKYDGVNVEVCYASETITCSGGRKDWFEPTEWELKNLSFIHFKI